METGIGLQFQELSKFTNTHFGLFFSRVIERWDKATDAARLHPIPKNLESRVGIQGLRFSTMPSCGRVQFTSRERPDFMLQVQPDRIGFNWRQQRDRDYPRFSECYRQFLEELAEFRQFVADEELGRFVPEIAEVIYVNQVEVSEGLVAGEALDRLFNDVSVGAPSMPPPVSFKWSCSYNFHGEMGKSLFELENPSEREIFFRNIGRCRCEGEPDVTVKDSIDSAHEIAIDTFVRLTTDDARKKWGQGQ